jgi:DNA topoisomerase-1
MLTKSLVIVESPAKCKKIASFLGPGFQVLATMGHIRALEEDLDAVGLERDFEPKYQFLKEKAKAYKPILDAAKGVDKIYLAADDDREGEAIAYSVACLLKKDPMTLPRAVFHEITATAVRNAIQNPRTLDMNRVNAQQARSVLDMMVGFTISPLLWKHVARGLSAGRCQTPALRLVFDREEQIRNHTSETSWIFQGNFSTSNGFSLVAKMEDDLDDQESAMNYLENIYPDSGAKVTSVTQKPWSLNPPKPLITSTLQQEASALFHINPKSTMKIAQTLYEGGHITYMRTDSAVLSEEAIVAAQDYIRKKHGDVYVGTPLTPVSKKEAPKKNKSKKEDTTPPQATAAPQEAHEAIRPTHMEVDELEGDFTPQEKKIYQLIWRRAVQACMSAAKGYVRIIQMNLNEDPDKFVWSSQFRNTEFPGWQILGSTAKLDDSETDESGDSQSLQWKQAQQIKEGTTLTWSNIQANPKATKAQPRFTEATLIRELEQKGIGRPSTFASLVETLFDKTYVEKKDIPGAKANQTTLLLKPASWPPETQVKQIQQGAEKQKLVPTHLGESVLRFCLKEFPQLFAYDFTANMEGRLDSVAKGDEVWKQLCRDTWSSYKNDYDRLMSKASLPSNSEKVKDFGNGFKAVMTKTGPCLVQETYSESSSSSTKAKPNTKFYPFPPGCSMSNITEEVARDFIQKMEADSNLGMWEGKTILKKKGPYGYYIECGDIRFPFTESESLQQIYDKLRERTTAKKNVTSVGGYRFATGQYGPYMYKEGLKTKNFVSIPPDTDVSSLTLAQAEQLYKDGVEKKKNFKGKGNWTKK